MEYVSLSPSEQNYSKKELLVTEMEILNVMKRYQKYKELRKQELALKSILRRKIIEVQEEIRLLDKILPKVHIEKTEEETAKITSHVVKRRDLESEIEEIKRKIERLQEE